MKRGGDRLDKDLFEEQERRGDEPAPENGPGTFPKASADEIKKRKIVTAKRPFNPVAGGESSNTPATAPAKDAKPAFGIPPSSLFAAVPTSGPSPPKSGDAPQKGMLFGAGVSATGGSGEKKTGGSIFGDLSGSVFGVNIAKPLAPGTTTGTPIFGTVTADKKADAPSSVGGAATAVAAEGTKASTNPEAEKAKNTGSGEQEPKPQEEAVKTGEEDETTLFQIRAKLHHLTGEKWADQGAGNFKINKNKEGIHRILFRTELMHRLILNYRLFPEFSCAAASEKSIRFSCVDPEKGVVNYVAQVKNPADAAALKAELTKAAADSPPLPKSSSNNDTKNSPKASSPKKQVDPAKDEDNKEQETK